MENLHLRAEEGVWGEERSAYQRLVSPMLSSWHLYFFPDSIKAIFIKTICNLAKTDCDMGKGIKGGADEILQSKYKSLRPDMGR